jgi:hypothetical protein
MSILYRKDLVKLDGSDPMLLYGYGSYEVHSVCLFSFLIFRINCNKGSLSAIFNALNIFQDWHIRYAHCSCAAVLNTCLYCSSGLRQLQPQQALLSRLIVYVNFLWSSWDPNDSFESLSVLFYMCSMYRLYLLFC